MRLLIVIDFQNDFICGSLGFEKAAELEGPIAEKIRQYRDSGDEIVFTMDEHNENYLYTQEGINLPIKHCLKGTNGYNLYGKVAELKKETDKCFAKPAFGSRELFEYIRVNDYKSIELVGLTTNICVLANAVLAKTAAPETPVLVDSGCVACADETLNEAALCVMKSMQIKISN